MNKEEVSQLLQGKIANASIKTRLSNVIVARDGAYVLVNTMGEKLKVKAHTPLVWFLPGILLAAVATTTIHTNMIWTFILYFIGTMIGGMLYAVLKKRDIQVLKDQVEAALGIAE